MRKRSSPEEAYGVTADQPLGRSNSIEVRERRLRAAVTLVLGESSVKTVLVPRDQVVWLPRTATPAEAEELVLSSGHTRLLVAGRGVDDVLGFLHAKDLLTVPEAARDRPLPLTRVRRMLVVRESTSLDDALLAMQQARIHMAVVADAAGRTLGIVSLEDIIEELVGDIRDESDR